MGPSDDVHTHSKNVEYASFDKLLQFHKRFFLQHLCFVPALHVQCSKTCEGGFRVREARCLSDDVMSSDACDEQLKPAEREDCNPEPCIPQIGQRCSTMKTHYYYQCEVGYVDAGIRH